MCVIFFCDKVRPTPLMIEAGYEANSDGGGMAWRENNLVKWKKGLDLEEMQNLARVLPIPFIMHFRIASIGGVTPQLTHPFEIAKNTTNALEGSTKNPVLFHNGHWNRWREDMREVSIKGAYHIPTGKWNDSRAMAWLAAHLGLGVLEMIDEKVIAFGPSSSTIFGGIWSVVNDILCSNRGWEGKFHTLKHQRNRDTSQDRRLLPEVYQPPPVVQHNPGCVCDDCIKAKNLTIIEAAQERGRLARERLKHGGSSSEPDPFLLAWHQWMEANHLFEMKPPKISKNQWKKAKRAFQVQSWRRAEQDRKMMIKRAEGIQPTHVH